VQRCAEERDDAMNWHDGYMVMGKGGWKLGQLRVEFLVVAWIWTRLYTISKVEAGQGNRDKGEHKDTGGKVSRPD
jgi:hypothetical protein